MITRRPFNWDAFFIGLAAGAIGLGLLLVLTGDVHAASRSAQADHGWIPAPGQSGAPLTAPTPPIADVSPVDWGDPSPTPRPVVHAPSGFGRTYLRVPATQAARDWAWHRLGTVQWACLDAIGHFESGWRVAAGSPDGSFGIFQARPASKMRRYGADYLTSAMTQVRFGIAYANARYGSPCGGWSFWKAHGWW